MTLENVIQWLGGLLAYFTLAIVLYGVWRGTQRQTGWGQLAPGKTYFVSTGFGAQLFAEHPLITSGPLAIVRHPMYAGLMLAAIGALVIYATWTTLFFFCFVPLLSVRAWNEERALAEEFGEEWRDHCRRVPMFFPRMQKE